MAVGLGIAALLVAASALAIALGVSLGRNSDRVNEYYYRQEVDDALGQLSNRLKRVEPEQDDPLDGET